MDSNRFETDEASVHPLPLPLDVDCHAVAGTIGRDLGDLKGSAAGDGLSPSPAPLAGQHKDAHRALAFSAVAHGSSWIDHLQLLMRARCHAALRRFDSDRSVLRRRKRMLRQPTTRKEFDHGHSARSPSSPVAGKCPAFSVCPLKGTLGDYKPEEKKPEKPTPASKKRPDITGRQRDAPRARGANGYA